MNSSLFNSVRDTRSLGKGSDKLVKNQQRTEDDHETVFGFHM